MVNFNLFIYIQELRSIFLFCSLSRVVFRKKLLLVNEGIGWKIITNIGQVWNEENLVHRKIMISSFSSFLHSIESIWITLEWEIDQTSTLSNFTIILYSAVFFHNFSLAKTKWRTLVTTYFRKTQRKTIRKIDFPKLLSELFTSSFTISGVSGGFRRAGVWPFNEAAMKEKVVREHSSLTSSTTTK